MSQDDPDVGAGPTTDATVKARLRREVLARRAAVPAPVRVRRDRAILDHLAGIVTAGMVVCGYVPCLLYTSPSPRD